MVLGVIVKSLGFDVTAVMVDYANRDTHESEVAFVADWCSRHLGVDLYVRVIDEISRDKCRKWELRELYETYTRNVRYACYKDVATANGDVGNPLVLLGHNHDDCFENILTNIAQQKKYDNLIGMTEVSSLDGICFLRPLLSVAKRDIYAFAKQFQVPHLPDSTVAWCQRGIIRDSIKPVMTKWNDTVRPFQNENTGFQSFLF